MEVGGAWCLSVLLARIASAISVGVVVGHREMRLGRGATKAWADRRRRPATPHAPPQSRQETALSTPVRTAPQVARSAPAKGSYRCSRREATPTVHLRILAAADHDRAAIELADSHRRDRAGVTGERARRHRSHRVRALCGDQCAAQGGVYHVGAGDDVPVVDDETRPDRTRPPREADQADVRETLSCHRLCAARSRQR